MAGVSKFSESEHFKVVTPYSWGPGHLARPGVIRSISSGNPQIRETKQALRKFQAPQNINES